MTKEQLIALGFSEEEATKIVAQWSSLTNGLINDTDHKAALQKVRDEERTKVYSEFEELKKQITSLVTEKETLTNTVTEKDGKIQEVSDSLEAVKASQKSDGKVDMSKLIEEVTGKQKAAFDKQLSDLRSSNDSKIEQLQADNSKLELERYKEKAIAAAGDRIVKALVSGSSKEEIDASVERAKAEFEVIAKSVGDSNSNNGNDGSNNPPPVPGGDTPPRGTGAEPEILQQVKNLTPEQYRKQRSEIMAATTQKYAAT